MAQRPRVGVTGNHGWWSPSWWCTAVALLLAGSIPERLSIRHQASGKPLSALIIGGGDDIGPEHYRGDVEAPVRSNPERDRMEIHWIKWALERRVPLLGICRGAQLINVVLGGTLYSDIRILRKKTYNRPGLLPTKTVRVDTSSGLMRLTGKSVLKVNSLHHQAIKEHGRGVRTVARDLDFFTQAIEVDGNDGVLGVQWHPEYLFYLPSQFSLFRWLIDKVR